MQFEPIPLWVNLLSVAVVFALIYLMALRMRRTYEADEPQEPRSKATKETSACRANMAKAKRSVKRKAA